jgi:hypothetical protein
VWGPESGSDFQRRAGPCLSLGTSAASLPGKVAGRSAPVSGSLGLRRRGCLGGPRGRANNPGPFSIRPPAGGRMACRRGGRHAVDDYAVDAQVDA